MLLSEIVAGENRLLKFHNTVPASHAQGCTRKFLCSVRSLPCGPRPASIQHLQNKSDGSNHVKASLFKPEAIS